MKVLFCLILPHIRESIALLEVHRRFFQ